MTDDLTVEDRAMAAALAAYRAAMPPVSLTRPPMGDVTPDACPECGISFVQLKAEVARLREENDDLRHDFVTVDFHNAEVERLTAQIANLKASALLGPDTLGAEVERLRAHLDERTAERDGLEVALQYYARPGAQDPDFARKALDG